MNSDINELKIRRRGISLSVGDRTWDMKKRTSKERMPWGALSGTPTGKADPVENRGQTSDFPYDQDTRCF